ncbi:methyltransferase domain-containing protein [candidate division CSSED10-310 bacterium]|uniref:Methyltransferase domain-containing protein n=1 Tax=candidate division CSSED10-310 bacterium TaxID=2855610 RepID=A0ABV6YSW5_UNCC1
MKLHIGCGSSILPGWTNIDIFPHPGVDHVLDVRDGLPFRDVRFIFAEHFIEHLDFDSALRFLRDCRSVLIPTGVIRLSTPNLDWVWKHQYHPEAWHSSSEAVRDCFWMNKAFRGWGHQFLYNTQTLAEIMLEAGFAAIEYTQYRVSRHPELQNIEQHDQYPDTPETPHVIVIEASGQSSQQSKMLQEPLREYKNAVLHYPQVNRTDNTG